MNIKYYPDLVTHTHLTDAQFAELKRALGATEAGSQMSFNFYFSLGRAERRDVYSYVGRIFPKRMFSLSNLGEEWAMLSISVTPQELDDPNLEEMLTALFATGIQEVMPGAKLVKVSEKPVDKS